MPYQADAHEMELIRLKTENAFLRSVLGVYADERNWDVCSDSKDFAVVWTGLSDEPWEFAAYALDAWSEDKALEDEG